MGETAGGDDRVTFKPWYEDRRLLRNHLLVDGRPVGVEIVHRWRRGLAFCDGPIARYSFNWDLTVAEWRSLGVSEAQLRPSGYSNDPAHRWWCTTSLDEACRVAVLLRDRFGEADGLASLQGETR